MSDTPTYDPKNDPLWLQQRTVELLEGIDRVLQLDPRVALVRGNISQAVDVAMNAAVDERIRENKRMYYRVAELAGAALTTDGAHHKQWFLEEILRALGLDPDVMDHPRGISP